MAQLGRLQNLYIKLVMQLLCKQLLFSFKFAIVVPVDRIKNIEYKQWLVNLLCDWFILNMLKYQQTC
jgi:hypothetical protein